MTTPRRPTLVLLALLMLAPRTPAQVIPLPVPPPRPPEPEPEETVPVEDVAPLATDDPRGWPGLPAELADALARTAERYRTHAVKFTSIETVREAKYENGEAVKEEIDRYGYLLERNEDASNVKEFRQKLRRNEPTGSEVTAAPAFPPAYEWVFLFSRFNQPYFAYRIHEDRFEGYDWALVIDFRGAIPYTDGKDIRQWEGTAIVDAVTHAMIEIRAEPSRQRERLQALFDRWVRAFNIVGFRTAPRPFGYRCRVTFLLRREGLNFPTELRYDTFRAVSSKNTIPWSASIRSYDDYRFFRTETEEKPGERAPER